MADEVENSDSRGPGTSTAPPKLPEIGERRGSLNGDRKLSEKINVFIRQLDALYDQHIVQGRKNSLVLATYRHNNWYRDDNLAILVAIVELGQGAPLRTAQAGSMGESVDEVSAYLAAGSRNSQAKEDDVSRILGQMCQDLDNLSNYLAISKQETAQKLKEKDEALQAIWGQSMFHRYPQVQLFIPEEGVTSVTKPLNETLQFVNDTSRDVHELLASADGTMRALGEEINRHIILDDKNASAGHTSGNASTKALPASSRFFNNKSNDLQSGVTVERAELTRRVSAVGRAQDDLSNAEIAAESASSSVAEISRQKYAAHGELDAIDDRIKYATGAELSNLQNQHLAVQGKVDSLEKQLVAARAKAQTTLAAIPPLSEKLEQAQRRYSDSKTALDRARTKEGVMAEFAAQTSELEAGTSASPTTAAITTTNSAQ